MNITEFLNVPTAHDSTPESNSRTVSYSQYKIWKTCPLQWKLLYVDNVEIAGDSIESIFGGAMHDTIQEWIPSHFEDSKRARKVDLNPVLKEKLISRFQDTITTDQTGSKQYVSDAVTLQEYFNDGCAILSHIQKYGEEFFPTRGFQLMGCEIKLVMELGKGLKFKAYIDILIHDTKLNHYHIIDLKTSRAGWYEPQKKDPLKVNQVLLYKKFWSEKFNVPPDNIFPRFIILKRKIKDHPDFIVRRIANFEPSHGKISLKKASESWEEFLTECFDESGNIRVDNLKATPSEKNCRYCPFANNEALCSVSYNVQKKQRQSDNRKMWAKKNG